MTAGRLQPLSAAGDKDSNNAEIKENDKSGRGLRFVVITTA